MRLKYAIKQKEKLLSEKLKQGQKQQMEQIKREKLRENLQESFIRMKKRLKRHIYEAAQATCAGIDSSSVKWCNLEGIQTPVDPFTLPGQSP